MADYSGPDQRKPLPPRIAATAAYGLGSGVILATAHHLLKCYQGGTFEWFWPDDALIEMWLLSVLPAIHLFGRVFRHQLLKLAGEEP